MAQGPDENGGAPASGPDENGETMTRDSEGEEEPQLEGGRAAERLRQHLEERYGEDAPPIPPDEQDQSEEEATSEQPGDAVDSGP